MPRRNQNSLRYTVERSEHDAGRGWVVVARCNESFAKIADAFRENGRPCRVFDADLPPTAGPVYTVN